MEGPTPPLPARVPLLSPPPSRSPPRAPPRVVSDVGVLSSLVGLLCPPPPPPPKQSLPRETSAPLQIVADDGIRLAARAPLLPSPRNQVPPEHSHVVDIPDDETSARPAPSLPASSTSASASASVASSMAASSTSASASATSSLAASPTSSASASATPSPPATQDQDRQQTFLALVLVTSLTILVEVHHLFPSTYRCYILGAFASVWVIAGIAFPVGTFGTCRAEKVCSRHASRFAFVAFALFIVYIFYVLSVTSPDVPSSSSSTSLTSPSPEAARPVDTFDVPTWFYGGLGAVALICHLALWIWDCFH